MPTLNWIGKEAVVNHDKEVPFRLLKKIKSASVGDNSQNLIIHGDNLEALKALMPFYYRKIKIVYIDPPYNTGNEKWIYNDKVNSPKIKQWLGKVVGRESEDLTRHDKWLCMMYPRLKLLRDLMSDDGAIFVSIDDNELHHFRSIMNEIFDEKNFIASVPRRTKSAGKTTGAIALNNDYVLVYAKNNEMIKFNSVLIDDKAYKFKDKYFDERGPYALSQTLDYDSLSYSKSLDYELHLNGKRFYPGNDKETYLQRKSGNHRASDWTWRWSKDLVAFGHKQGYLVVKKGKDGNPRIYTKTYFKVVIEKINGSYKIVPIDRTKKLTTLDLMGSEYSNDVAKKDLRALFGAKAEFAYPKPVSLIKYLIKTISGNENSIILDSFSGSGTSGHAVLDLNKEDNGNRKFVMVEMEDKVANKITAERIRRAIEKYEYKSNFEYCELDNPLFDENGKIDNSCDFKQLATYIYFTETQTNIDLSKIKNNFIGDANNTEYYLIYKGKNKNDLDKSIFMKIKKNEAKKIVYADRCLIDDDTLQRYNIVFKQIPYEVKVY